MFILFSVLVLTAATQGPAAGADEAALRARAARFYELQIAGNRLEAAQIVEPDSRGLFVNGKAVAFVSCEITRVTVAAPDRAEVEVKAEVIVPLFVNPVSRSFITPWKKIDGTWYFVVDTSAIQAATSQGKAASPAPQQARPVLTFRPPLSFGEDAAIEKSVQLENNSAGIVQFRVAVLDDEWLEVRNQKGEIPPGQSFPLIIVLKRIPEEHRTLKVVVEATEPDRRIFQLEIPVKLQPPQPLVRNEMVRAIRVYRAEH
ncbi:MAG: hypothetical protein HYX74_03025 [Acidobacteria bacterium]|nr:hypothetical protein [Acidobacteriota bacterium]